MSERRVQVGEEDLGWLAELEHLLERVCRQVIESLGVTSCVLSQWDRDRSEVVVWAVLADRPEQELAHVRIGQRYALEQSPLAGRVIQAGAVVAVHLGDPEADPVESALLEEIGQRSLLMLPLMADEEVIGLLEIFQQDHPRSFTPQEITLAQALANQVAAFLENAYLFQERGRRITELSIVNEIGRALSSAMELAELLELVHQQVSRIYDTTNFFIASYEEGSDEWVTIFDVEGGKRNPLGRYQVGAGVTGYILRNCQPVLLRDAQEGRAFHEEQGISFLGEPAKSWLGVPMIAADKIVGAMAIQSYEQENLYDLEDLIVFSTIAAQVANALENLRLLEETRRWARQMEVINEVGQAITSVLDLEELLQQIMDITKARFRHYFVNIALVEEDRLVVRGGSTIGHSDKRLDVSQVSIDLAHGPSLVAEAARTGQPVLVNDVLSDPRYLPVEELADTRAELTVPIKFKDRVIGVLDVQSERTNAYGPADIVLLRALASQAGVAIENARFFQERGRRITELAILNEIGQALSSALELGELLEMVYQQVGRIFDTTNFYVALYDRDRREWETPLDFIQGQRHLPERYSVDEGLTGFILRNRQSLLFHNPRELAAFHKEQGIGVIGEHAKSWMGVPMIAADRVVGAIGVESYEREGIFSDDDLAVLSTVAAQAAIAIENARFYRQVQEQLEELRQAGEVQARLLEQVQEMSTPVIPVHDRILVLPLIGVVDTERARQFTERLLEEVRQQRARVVLLDITGVPVVDTAVAQALLQAAEATRLLGAEVVLVGIRSEVAQTLVTLGLSLEGLVTKANLQAGIAYALGQLGLRITL